MMFESKLWGTAAHIFDSPSHATKVDVAMAARATRSSWHSHSAMCNMFYVISGKILVEYISPLGPGGMVETRRALLGPTQNYTVPPGVVHRFRAVQPSTFVEVYWQHDMTRPAAGLDIIRLDVGGDDNLAELLDIVKSIEGHGG